MTGENTENGISDRAESLLINILLLMYINDQHAPSRISLWKFMYNPHDPLLLRTEHGTGRYYGTYPLHDPTTFVPVLRNGQSIFHYTDDNLSTPHRRLYIGLSPDSFRDHEGRRP